MLVYLDTANLSAYAGAKPRHQRQFRSLWRNARAELALSFIHLIELRQYGGQDDRRARYEALRDFLPIHTTMNLARTSDAIIDVEEREVLHAARSRGLSIDPDAAADCGETVTPFRFQIDTVRTVDLLQEAEHSWFAAGVQDMASAIRIGNVAQQREPGTAADDQPFSSLADEPLSPAAGAAMRAAAVASFGPALLASGSQTPGQISKDLLGGYLDWVGRAESVGPRQAAAEKLGFMPTGRDASRTLRDLRFDADFKARVRATLDRYCSRADPTDREATAQTIRLVDCPGRWLWREIERQARLQETSPNPGNYWDQGHVMYLPYVDRYFTDKRMDTYIAQALRRPDCPASLTNEHVRRNTQDLALLAAGLA